MSETTNASADLGLAAPAAPADQQAAAARKAELMSNKDWVAKKLSGDEAANLEMRKLNEIIVGAEADQPAAVDGREIEHLRSLGLADAVIKQVETRQPVSQEEFDRASRLKSSLMKDPTFVRSYLDGSYEARQKMALIGIVLQSPIKGAK
jgi:hypothetical protein